TAPIKAYDGILDVAYTFRTLWQPRFALRGSQSSGERNPNQPALQSLDPLYPRAVALSGAPVGPVNLTNIHPGLDLQLSRALATYGALDVSWRTRIPNGIYDAGGGLTRTALSTPDRDIGRQPGGQLDC